MLLRGHHETQVPSAASFRSPRPRSPPRQRTAFGAPKPALVKVFPKTSKGASLEAHPSPCKDLASPLFSNPAISSAAQLAPSSLGDGPSSRAGAVSGRGARLGECTPRIQEVTQRLSPVAKLLSLIMSEVPPTPDNGSPVRRVSTFPRAFHRRHGAL